MNLLESLRDAPFLQRLGWALLAFLWQGALAAGLLAALQTVLRGRKPQARYSICCAALLVMLAMPATTFLRASSDLPRALTAAAARAGTAEDSRPAADLASPSSLARTARGLGTEIRRIARPMALPLVGLWLVGVLLLSARFLTGWAAAQSLRWRDARTAPESLRALSRRVAQKLAVSRPVLLLQSAAVSVPAALGVFKPVILLPLSVVTGLSGEEIEAVLAHELAHIRRHDYLVNLIQTAAETLLFYHPAVWWVSRQIRLEREKCCDDLAVAATGDSRVYVRALLELEQLRGARPQFAVAATGGSLWGRVARLLPSTASPAEGLSHSFAGAIALAILCALGGAAGISGLEQSNFAAETRATGSKVAAGTLPTSLSPDERTAFRTHGVTPAFLSEIQELLGALSFDECLSLRIHGVTPEYVRGFQAAGYAPISADQAVSLRIHGVRSEDAAGLTKGARKPTLDDLISARIHGVSPAFAAEMESLGFQKDLDTLVSFRIHGVTSDFARALHSLGYTSLSADEAISTRIHGMTPEFIRQANQSAGGRLSIDELVGLRIQGRGRR